ncbi:ribosomal-protein-alanine N-acetyltransferase [Paracoccus halophilus]|uniref:Alanine acetyltransferase n=1 Tax=Paracoccus halophilus TaxID=376733 RepID=A0A099F8X4_9RHOB|nr:GNAT family N-acetyltransferase [Paracoccus halophilus]KGJ06696.1 alanine acetyltransferase [Paracoccus halophilus]SFA42128.1 ribosomal-protein-alanine N-acetyltransferase [Paracoccus halophilus]
MTPEALAALHARCFPAHPRPWSAAEFTALLSQPLNFLILRPRAFLIGRVIADEAELLTLAVAPEARRQGLALALLDEFTLTSQSRGADEAFLEVASDNAPALALYSGNNWEKSGTRRDYYAPGVDAVIMRRALGPRQTC